MTATDKLDISIETLRAQVGPTHISDVTLARSEIVMHLADMKPEEIFAVRDAVRAMTGGCEVCSASSPTRTRRTS